MFVRVSRLVESGAAPQAGYASNSFPSIRNGLPTGAYEDFATGFPGVETFTNRMTRHYYGRAASAVGPTVRFM